MCNIELDKRYGIRFFCRVDECHIMRTSFVNTTIHKKATGFIFIIFHSNLYDATILVTNAVFIAEISTFSS